MRVLFTMLTMCLTLFAGCAIGPAPDYVKEPASNGYAKESDLQPPEPPDEYFPTEKPGSIYDDEHEEYKPNDEGYKPNEKGYKPDKPEAFAYIVANGIPIFYAAFHIPEGEIFPTHVPLEPIATAFGKDIYWDDLTDQVSLSGLAGEIFFVIGEAGYMVDGVFVPDNFTTLVLEGEIYVPLPFFRLAFGVGSAYFSGGTVFIHAEGGDME